MLDIRMIATDLDGTLLSEDSTVSERNAAALRECARRGIYVILASGRLFQNVRMMTMELGLGDQPIVSSNGARLDASAFGEMLVEDCVPADVSLKTARMIRDSGMYGVAYTREKGYCINAHKSADFGYTVGVRQYGDMQYHIVDDWELFLKEGVDKVHKYVAYSRNLDEVAALRAQFETLPAEINQAYSFNVELMKQGVNKGNILLRFAETKGISRDQIMTFGDYLNDEAMLKVAGWPVAMENGRDELKAIARIIAPHHNDSGVGRVLEKYVLGKEEQA